MTLGGALLEVFLGFRTQPAAFDAVLVRGETAVSQPTRVPASSWNLKSAGRAVAAVTFGPYRTTVEYDGIRLRADGAELVTERFEDTAKIPANWVQIHELTLVSGDG